MNLLLNLLTLTLNIYLGSSFFNAYANIPTTRLEGSFGHVENAFEIVGQLDLAMNLTLTLVTGSLNNTQLVTSFYQSIQGLTLFDQTDIHLKLIGNVGLISRVFNTSFSEYTCDKQNVCYASNSEVFIPESLKSAIIGILGLETVLSVKPNFVLADHVPLNESHFSENLQPQATYASFVGYQAAQVYGFPNSDASGIRIGIISLGGYFRQSDLDSYFTKYSLGTAPTVNVVYVNGASMDFVDINDNSAENYLDVEIIASVSPKATITFFFAPNTFTNFYDALRRALQQSDVVSVSWGSSETGLSSYWTSYQTLFATYSSVPVFIATGDHGSTGGAGFPASCPNAIGKLFANNSTFIT